MMAKMKLGVLVVVAPLSLALVVSCGGGSSDSPVDSAGTKPTPTPAPLVNGSGNGKPKALVSGKFTQRGSIFVNGVEYATDVNTVVMIDGVKSSAANLQPGMVLTVKGSIDSTGSKGTATRIDYADVLQGVVTAKKATSGSRVGEITVMGQAVKINANTRFDSSDLDSIVANNVVEVSGFTAGDGTVYASYVGIKAAATTADPYEIKGVVSAVNIAQNTITIGKAPNAVVVTNTASGSSIKVGSYVQVSTTQPLDNTGAIVADTVTLAGDGSITVKGKSGDDVELDGVVTKFDPTNKTSVEINGQTVKISAAQAQVLIDLGANAVGTEVDFSATFGADGVLTVSGMAITPEPNFVLTGGYVDAVDAVNHTVTILGAKFKLTGETVMVAGSGVAAGEFNYNRPGLKTGNGVVVVAAKTKDGMIITEIVQFPSVVGNYSVVLVAPVDSGIANGKFVASGITIDVSGVSPFILANTIIKAGGYATITGNYSPATKKVVATVVTGTDIPAL